MRIYPRLLKFWMVLVLSILFVHSAKAQDTLPTIVKKIEQSVVAIMIYDKEGEMISEGTGFFISDSGDVITARHVLAGASRAEIKTAGGKVYPVRWIVAEDKEGDLIRLAVDIPEPVIPVLVSSSIPEPGESVFLIGGTFVPGITTMKGIVSSVRDYYREGKTIKIVAPGGGPGYSGSPVVNTKGFLVGVIKEGGLFERRRPYLYASLAERVDSLKPIKKLTLAELKKDEAEEFYLLGFEFILQGKYNEALEAYKQAISIDSGFADAYRNLGFVYGKLSLYDEEIASYKQAISIDSGFADAYYNLGGVYNKLSRYDEAIASYKQAISIDSGFAGAYYNLGGVHHGLGRLYEAKEALEHAVRLDPDYADARGLLGAVSFKIALYEKEIEACKQVIQAKPDSAEAHYTLGCLYIEVGNYSEAMKACEQAVHIKPDYADAHYKLGNIHLQLGDTASAKNAYERLKKLDEDLADKLFYEISKRDAEQE